MIIKLSESQMFDLNTKLTHIELINIEEGKQVGTLYHYTSLNGALSIIDSNELLKNTYTGFKAHVSMTRNKNFHKLFSGIGGTKLSLVLDGDKLSNNFKIEPYHDNNMDFGGKESEERVYGESIKNINKYLIGVRLHFDKVDEFDDNEEYKDYREACDNYFKSIQVEKQQIENWFKNKNIKVLK